MVYSRILSNIIEILNFRDIQVKIELFRQYPVAAFAAGFALGSVVTAIALIQISTLQQHSRDPIDPMSGRDVSKVPSKVEEPSRADPIKKIIDPVEEACAKLSQSEKRAKLDALKTKYKEVDSGKMLENLTNALGSGTRFEVGSGLAVTFKEFTDEVIEDIKYFICLDPVMLHTTVGGLRARGAEPPISIAFHNPFCPIEVIKYLLDKGAAVTKNGKDVIEIDTKLTEEDAKEWGVEKADILRRADAINEMLARPEYKNNQQRLLWHFCGTLVGGHKYQPAVRAAKTAEDLIKILEQHSPDAMKWYIGYLKRHKDVPLNQLLLNLNLDP